MNPLGIKDVVCKGHESSVRSVAWSPDGARIVSGSNDNTAKVWSTETGECLSTLTGHENWVRSVAWSPDGARIVSGSNDNTVRVWSAETGECLSTLNGHMRAVTSVAWSPDGARILSGSFDKTIKVWSAETGECLSTLTGHEGYVYSVAWSPDGAHIVSGSEDKTIKVWSAETGECLSTLTGHEGYVYSVAWSPDGARIVSGSSDKTAKVWSAADSGECLSTLTGHVRGVTSVAWSPDGARIVSGSDDRTIKMWSAETGECLTTLTGHEGLVSSVAQSPDGARILSGSSDKTAKMWSAETGECLSTLTGHEDEVYSVAWSPDGARILSGSYDKTIKVWSAETGECLSTLTGHEDEVYSVAWSPDGARIVSGSYDNTAKVWSAETGECLSTLTGHKSEVYSVAWSPDGARILSGSRDRTIKVWSAETGGCLSTLTGHENWVSSVAWSPDGARIVSGSNDNTAKVWSAETGECLSTLTGHEGPVYSVAWSPDGARILSGSWDLTAKVWSAETCECLSSLTGHEGLVYFVAWSTDGARIVSGSYDKTAKVWSAVTGECLSSLTGHERSVSSVAWSPDGARIVSGSNDKTIKVWSAETGECLTTLTAPANPVLQGSNEEDASGALLSPNAGVQNFSLTRTTLTRAHPASHLRMSFGQEVQVKVDFVARTLAVQMAGCREPGDQETTRPEVTFFLPVPGPLERVEFCTVLGPQRPEGGYADNVHVKVNCVYLAWQLTEGGRKYRLLWSCWMVKLPRARVRDVFPVFTAPPEGGSSCWIGHGGPLLGCFVSYLHHMVWVGAPGRRTEHFAGFEHAVQTWPRLRTALRARDLLGRTPLDALLVDRGVAAEDVKDMLRACLHDAKKCCEERNPVALEAILTNLVASLPRIRDLKINANTVWEALDRYGYLPTVHNDESLETAIKSGANMAGRRSPTFTSRLMLMLSKPGKEDDSSDRFKLMRCLVPDMFTPRLIAPPLALMPTSEEGQNSEPHVQTEGIKAPFVPWEEMLATMPSDYFSMPLARAAAEHQRPSRLLLAAFLVHMSLTAGFLLLLLWDPPSSQARAAILGTMMALGSVLIFVEAVQLTVEVRGTEAQGPEAKRDNLQRMMEAAAAYFGSVYNMVDLLLCLCPPVLLVIELTLGPKAPAFTVVLAVGVLTCFLKFLNFMRALMYFAAIVAMLERIIVRTVPDVVLLLVLTVGFAGASHALLLTDELYELQGWQMLLRHLMRYTLGDAGIFEYESEARIVDGVIDVDDGFYLDLDRFLHSPAHLILFAAINIGYLYLTVIIFLNLLIARMGSIYEEVEERQLSSLTYSCACIYHEYRQKWRMTAGALEHLGRLLSGQAKSSGLETLPSKEKTYLYRWHPRDEEDWEPSTRAAPETGMRPIFKTLHKVEDVEKSLQAMEGKLMAAVEQRMMQLQAENSRVQAENSKVQAENSRVQAENSRVQAENSRLLAEVLKAVQK